MRKPTSRRDRRSISRKPAPRSRARPLLLRPSRSALFGPMSEPPRRSPHPIRRWVAPSETSATPGNGTTRRPEVDGDIVEPDPTTVTGPGAPTDRLLDLVWRRHRQWSVAANAARARLDRWRLWNLALLVLGALLGALAAQTWLTQGVATGSAIAAAIALGLAGILQANALNADQTARWTH